jgi:uncharacterized membrane protein YphA (DoxX/SURF4 family)
MQRSAIVFLILLRLAIGWHFLFEGIQKVQSTWTGPTVTNRPFSSAGYFREATGPLGWLWRWKWGDPDKDALAHLEVKPLADSDEPATARPHERMPPKLEEEWDDYLKRFAEHYGVMDKQLEQAESKLAQSKSKVVEWLTYVPPATREEQDKDKKYSTDTTEQTKTFPSGELKRRLSMAERIKEYKSRLDDLPAARQRIWSMGKDVEGARLRAAKAEIAGLRAGLRKDLDSQTQEMKKSLDSVLTAEQKENEKPVPGPKGDMVLAWLDWLTMWLLVVIGVGLMIGLFTRLNAWLGAGFLLMTYLAVPAIPWLPSPPISEGNYVFVNKNVVEFFALCVIATTYSGRWFGLDGLLHNLRCWITGKQPQPQSQT